MHALPEREALLWLLNDRLDRVGTAEFMISFSFDGGGVLDSSVPVTVIRPDGSQSTYHPQLRGGTWSFQLILGDTVTEVERPNPWMLDIVFSGGARLRLISRPGPYECGRMLAPDRSETFY